MLAAGAMDVQTGAVAAGSGVLQVVWGLLKIIIGLVVVGGLAYLTTRFLTQRLPAGQGRGAVRVLGHVYLGGRRGVSILKVGRRVLVLGVTDHQVSLLESVTDPVEVSALEEGAVPSGLASLSGLADNPQWDKVRERMREGFDRLLREKLARGGKEGKGRRDQVD